MATKRKHVTLTLSEKLKIIDLRGSECSLARISAEYGIGKSTVCDRSSEKGSS